MVQFLFEDDHSKEAEVLWQGNSFDELPEEFRKLAGHQQGECTCDDRWLWWGFRDEEGNRLDKSEWMHE